FVCGDNAFHEDPENRLTELVKLAAPYSADVLIAGPAFGSGRYGVACAQICDAISTRLGLPAITAMSPENPGIALCSRSTYVFPTTEDVMGMRNALESLAGFAVRLATGDPIGSAATEGYIPRGRRLNVFESRTGAERVVDLLTAKLRGDAWVSEIPVPVGDSHPAPPLRDLKTAKIALITEGGIVPRGNPDRIESRRATMWRKYL